MILSSYLSTTSKFKVSKLLPLIIQIDSTSILAYLFARFIRKSLYYSSETALKFCMPISHGAYWYFGPFLMGRIIETIFFKALPYISRNYLLLTTCSYCSINFLKRVGLFSIVETDSFLMMALIASCIKYYPPKGSSLLWMFITILVLISHIGALTGFYNRHMIDFPVINTIMKIISNASLFSFQSMLVSIAMFITFTKIKIKKSKITEFCSLMSRHSMGIYMIHYAETLMGLWLKEIMDLYNNKGEYLPGIIKLWFKVIFISFIIDYIREKLFNLIIFYRRWYLRLTAKIDILIPL